MNNLENSIFNNIPCILQHVPANDLINVARTCKRLNIAINTLTTSYWTKQIELDAKIFDEKGFPPHGVVKWLNMVQDRHLAKITYITFRFLCSLNKKDVVLDFCKDLKSMIPAPILCTRLLNTDLSSFPDYLMWAWEVVPDSDKQILFEMIAEKSLSSALLAFHKKTAKCYADFVDRGLNELIDQYPEDTRDLVFRLLIEFVEINELSAIDKLLTLKNKPLSKNDLNALLEGACKVKCKITILQRIIDAGAKPAEITMLLHQVVTYRSVDELPDILSFLINYGALVTTWNIKGNTPLKEFICLKRLRDGGEFVVELLAKHGDLETAKECFNEILINCGSLKIFQVLQDLGAYQTPAFHVAQLHYESCKWDLALFRALLVAGEDPNTLTENGKSVLSWHIERTYFHAEEIFSWLSLFDKFKADFTKDRSLLHVICKRQLPNRGKSVKFLLNKGLKATEEYDNTRPINLVVSNYDPDTCDDVIEILLNAGETLSSISDVNLRFFLYCYFGKINEIKNWTGDLPVEHRQKIKGTVALPIVAAIKNRHLDIVEFLLKKKGQKCLKFNWNGFNPFRAALQLEYAPLRQKMIKLIVKELGNSSLAVCLSLYKLITAEDFQLFKEIFNSMSKDVKIKYLSEHGCHVVDRAIKTYSKGHMDILEEIIKILPNEAWYFSRALFKLSSEKNAQKILQKLYEKHPECLTHKNDVSDIRPKNFYQVICSRMTADKKFQVHYHQLFLLVNSWIEKKPKNEIKTFQREGLISLFESFYYKESYLFDLKVENLPNIVDILFKRELFKIKKDTQKNILSLIYDVFFTTCQTMKSWEKMKKILKPLQLNFGIRNRYVQTPLHSMKISKSKIAHSLKKQNDPTKLLLIYKDMIRFAYENNVQKGIFLDADVSPLHKVVSIDGLQGFFDKDIKVRAELISLALADELINCGHPIDVKDLNGDTPLHKAVRDQNMPAAFRLLKAEANFNIKNKIGKTALDIAKDAQHLDLIAAMSKYNILIKEKSCMATL